MTKKGPQLDPAIEALVRERLQPDECVHHKIELRHGEIAVALIDQGSQEIMRRFRRGGSGRMLEFRMQNDQWVLVGESRWIS